VVSSRASHGRGRPSGRQLPALLRRLPSHHSHFVLVPGENWGDESRWLSRVAQTLAEDRPTVTILINGGEIALRDVQHSVDAHRPVLVLEGSGRAADDLATGSTAARTTGGPSS
jgi:hypothetical protein